MGIDGDPIDNVGEMDVLVIVGVIGYFDVVVVVGVAVVAAAVVVVVTTKPI